MSFPTPAITNVNRPYWTGLQQGKLRYQRCLHCLNAWLPARPNCPNCLSANLQWHDASGHASVLSWVVYHTAYAEHLQSRLPYDVTLVELEEGPRLLTNVIDSDAGRRLAPGAAVHLAIEREDDIAIPRFRLTPIEGEKHE